MTAENKIAFFLPEETATEQGLTLASTGSTHATGAEQSSATASDSNTSGITRRPYGRASMVYSEVAEHGLRPPANDNKGQFFKTYGPVFKIGLPVLLGLAFLAWF